MGIASELRRLLGNDAVADDPQTLADHSGDKWFAHETPEVVVFAGSSDEVKKLLRFASENKISVTARGPATAMSAVASRFGGGSPSHSYG